MPRRREFKGVCPRCGEPVSWVESYRRGGRAYYVAVHYYGYDPLTRRKYVRKCYLGPEVYDYVSRTHAMSFEGAHRDVASPHARALDYLDALIGLLRHTELEPSMARALAKRFRVVAEALERAAEAAERAREG